MSNKKRRNRNRPVSVPPHLLEQQRARFKEKFGRDPLPHDPVFFDPSADTPHPMNAEVVEQTVAEAMHAAGIDPALIYASQKTGMIITESTKADFSKADLAEWGAALEDYDRLHGGKGVDPAMVISDNPAPWTADQVADILANPIYTGVGPFPQLVPDNEWVKASVANIEEEGAEAWLRRMLRVLRAAFDDHERDQRGG